MFTYIVKRLLLFVPTLILVSCLAFFLKNNVPSDPVESILNLQGINESKDGYYEAYNEKTIELGLDRPSFYLGVHSNYSSWLTEYDGSILQNRFASDFADEMHTEGDIMELMSLISDLDDLSERRILQCQNTNDIIVKLESSQFQDVALLKKEPIRQFVQKMSSNKVSWHYPVIKWHGLKNQYHHWISKIIKGDFGMSIIDGRPVFDKIFESLRWTLVLLIGSLSLSVLISFFIGVYNGTHQNSRFDNWTNSILFLFYSIPKFWFATVMIIFFTTAEYGGWTDIFPITGRWESPSDGFLNMIFGSLDKLALPFLVMTIPDVAYLSRLIRASIIEENKKEYINTARSKGIPSRQILLNHLIPNSISPTITLLAGVIPGALGSSLIIEVIFNIPGVGRLMFESIQSADWAVVYPIVFIISIVAVIIFLLADLLVAWLNPKINLG